MQAPLPEITATSNVTLEPVTSVPASPPHTYLGMAKAFASGAQALVLASKTEAISIGFLSAQSVECALKAYLSRSGDDKRLKNKTIRHDLEALWALASDEGLNIPALQPAWLVTLGHLHGSPYYLRYSTGVNGLVFPPTEPMVSEIASLVDLVAKKI